MSSTNLSLRQRLHQQPYWIAIGIVILIVAWVASGTAASAPEHHKEGVDEETVAKVKVARLDAQAVNRDISLYGRTEPDRIANLRAEVEGTVDEILVQEGQRVEKGQVLLRLNSNDLKQRLRSAKAMLVQREIELDAAQSLDQQGFQSKANLAAARANVEASKASVAGLELMLSKIEIKAPFAGILNQRYVEVGDLLKNGDQVATIVDLDPLIIVADVTETHVHQLTLGQDAVGRVVSGDELQGHIRYISSTSNVGTNTFNIEVSVPNEDYTFLAGMSTELAIPLEQTWAIKITPAVMALDEQGNLGVKTVVNEHVKFVPIDMVKSDSEGVWLGGMGQQADVIVLGHGYVRDGDKVEASYDDVSEERGR